MSDQGVRQQVRSGLVVPVIGALLLGTAGYNTLVDNRNLEDTRATVINALPTATPTPTKTKKNKTKKNKKKSGGN
jgi:hypothetical protein